MITLGNGQAAAELHESSTPI